ELVTATYRNSFFNPLDFKRHGVAVASARAGNVIGGGDWAADRLIPDIIRAALRGEKVRIRNPRAIRPWQHVLEPLSGYLLLARKLLESGPEFAGGWNFGPGPQDVRSVGQVAERFAALWGGRARLELDQGAHPHEAGLLTLDCSKARALLAWRPSLELDTALAWTANWYLAWAAGADAGALTGLLRGSLDEYLSA
ncbi:MAG: CDP-glucose 4,6-dehydratase, partial [Desulfovibrio sp.]|nr:CDP-glucose 4,6-dehydratase [Desulfovibrio sp.]